MEDDTFEKLEVWQEAIELAAGVYELFRDCKDWGFRSQIQEAAVSISSTIAEGYERSSNAESFGFWTLQEDPVAKFVHRHMLQRG